MANSEQLKLLLESEMLNDKILDIATSKAESLGINTMFASIDWTFEGDGKINITGFETVIDNITQCCCGQCHDTYVRSNRYFSFTIEVGMVFG
jgi:hypothetical protein